MLVMSWWKDGNVTVILLQSAKNVNIHLMDVPPAKWYRSKLWFCLLHSVPIPTPTPTPTPTLSANTYTYTYTSCLLIVFYVSASFVLWNNIVNNRANFTLTFFFCVCVFFFFLVYKTKNKTKKNAHPQPKPIARLPQATVSFRLNFFFFQDVNNPKRDANHSCSAKKETG